MRSLTKSERKVLGAIPVRFRGGKWVNREEIAVDLGRTLSLHRILRKTGNMFEAVRLTVPKE